MSKFPTLASVALSVFMVGAFSSGSDAKAPEISQRLHDRYGPKTTNEAAPKTKSINSSRESLCSHKFSQQAQGIIFDRDFNNGRGRETVTVKPNDGGTLKYNIELGTRGLPLPPASC